MKTKISLSVKSTQKLSGMEPQVMEFVTEGLLYEKPDAHYIIYDESELSGLEGHRTCLRISAKNVIMSRFGEHKLKMFFEVGERYTTKYHTPAGLIKIEYLTNDINLDISARKGIITVDYDMAIKDLQEGNNLLEVSYKKILE